MWMLLQESIGRGRTVMAKMMRVLIADDEPAVRSALRLILQDEPGVSIVSEVEGSDDLETQLHRYTPDVMLLDWELPDMRPDRLLPSLRVLHPRLKVVALSGRPEALRQAAAAGVDAFVSKGSAPDELLSVLRDLKVSHG